MALPEIPDELLVEILLRLPTAADLIRASASCVSFRRLVADRSFLRRFRKLHPPPLLGFLDPERHRFHPAVPPHPSAPVASAVASVADFSFDFLPGSSWDWSVMEVRDGRVLLDRPRRHDAGERLGALFKEMVVCDPLHRQYLLLPPIPVDVVSVVGERRIEGPFFADCFLVPSGDDEQAAAATEETSFRVIWMVLLQPKLVAVIFSSDTGQWRTVPSLTWSEQVFYLVSRHYANGCFYWISGSSSKMLVLDIRRMEFFMADRPPCVSDDVAIVDAGQGMTLMFVPKPDASGFKYTVWRNNGGISTQWQMEKKIFSLDSGSLLTGAVGRHLLIYHCGSSSINTGGFTLDINKFQLERVCAALPNPSHVYCNFPPPLLSSPTVSSATPNADVQGAGDDVLVPGLREADPGGVQGPVVAAAARAPNPLLVVEDNPEAGHGGARRRRWGWVWGWTCGGCRAG